MKRNTDTGTFIQTHTTHTWQTTWISSRLSIALLSHILRDLVLGASTMSDIGNHQVKKKKIREPSILSYSQSILVSYIWSERNQNVQDCFWQT